MRVKGQAISVEKAKAYHIPAAIVIIIHPHS
jgi:hypothetical protein